MQDTTSARPASTDAALDALAAEPARTYETPAAVVADDSLSREQKLGFLRAWADDLAGHGNAASPDALLLRLVRAAIADLEIRR